MLQSVAGTAAALSRVGGMDPATPVSGELSVEELAEHDRGVAALTQATRELAEGRTRRVGGSGPGKCLLS